MRCLRVVALAAAALALASPGAAFDFDPTAYAMDLPGITNLRVVPGNQRIDASWDVVVDPNVTGYRATVWHEDRILCQSNTTQSRFSCAPAVNGEFYLVEVSVRDAEDRAGPPAFEFAQPVFEDDQTYLALGLIVVWGGVLGYAVMLAHASRRLALEISRTEKEKQRIQGPP